MAKGKKKEEEASPQRRAFPRNTVTWSLDGEPHEVRASFEASQTYFRYWFFCRAQYRIKVGNKMIYTCPLDGTFYYLVRYQGKFVVFIIVARQYWLVGIWNSHGFFQSVWQDNKEFYMDSNKTLSTGFGLNHKDVGDGGVDLTRMGVWPLREGHNALSTYEGPHRPEPEGFREAWDTYIVYIMETKFLKILRRCCNSMDSFGRLGPGARDLVVQWRSLCRDVMQWIEEGVEAQQEMDRAYELMGTILIYHVDAWAEGETYCHPPLPPKPREEIWAPIDEGDGDGDIQNPDAAAPLPRAPPRPERVTSTKARGQRKRGSIQVEDKHGKRPRKECIGLRGGGVGGSATVPHWFLEWRQEIGNKKILSDLVTAAKKELGLTFVEAPVLRLKQVQEEMQNLQWNNVGNQLAEPDDKGIKDGDVEDTRDRDVESIIDGGFITDGVITRFFQSLAPRLRNQVNLVSPATSLAFARDPSAMDVALLATSEINIFPVNDNTSDEPDGGSHWSVMVLYRPNNSAPRLVHHDSTYRRINTRAAEHLANSIRSVLPPLSQTQVEHANTPLQQNGVDCAVFLMAIANSIGCWWLRGHQGQQQQEEEEDWVSTVMRDVNQSVVTQMRDLLPGLLEGHMTMKELISMFFSGNGVGDQGENELP